MSDFRQLTDEFWASPQVELGDIAEAKALGVALIVNNRPEGEAPDQVSGAAIEAAARSAGIAYRAIPVTHAGFSEDQVRAMTAARGEAPDAIAATAAAAGYDVSPIRALIDMLAAQRTK